MNFDTQGSCVWPHLRQSVFDAGRNRGLFGDDWECLSRCTPTGHDFSWIWRLHLWAVGVPGLNQGQPGVGVACADLAMLASSVRWPG